MNLQERSIQRWQMLSIQQRFCSLSKNKEEFERVMKPVLDLFRMDKQESTLLDMCPEFFASLSNLPEK